MKRIAIRIAAFLAIAVLLFYGHFYIVNYNFAYLFKTYYSLPADTVDVLFVGASHAYRSVNPALLYEESGISSFVLGSAGQPLWNTYYYMKEALKTQHPKVVFVECYKAYLPKEYEDGALTYKAAAGMRLSRDYVDMIEASVENPDDRFDYYLKLPAIHTRYMDIAVKDMLARRRDRFYRNYLGFTYYLEPVEAELPRDMARITGRRPLTEKNRYYLDRMVELAREEDVALVFLIAPFYDYAVQRQPFYNSLADYAAQQGVPLINGNLMFDALALEGDRDFGRANHLTLTGADKLTRYIDGFLRENYSLEDHRGDPRFERWARNCADLRQLTADGSAREIDDD